MNILISFAHPDDESFIIGGLIHKLSKNKHVKTMLYSATAGDAGKCGEPPICGRDKLGEVRSEELRQAAHILGVDELVIDSYKDKHVHEHKKEIEEKLINIIQSYKPKILITFPAHGISKHSDHIAMHEITLNAVRSLGNSIVKKVYFATFPSKVKANRLHLEGDAEIDVTITLNDEDAEACKKALLAHKTQHVSVERVLKISKFKDKFKKFNNQEYLVIGYNTDDTIRIEDYLS